MDRIDHATADADVNGVGRPGFTDGEVATQTPATVVTAEWLNGIQEEIARAIEQSGGTLDAEDDEQLYAAMLTPVQRTVTPTQITADVDDYAPTGLAGAAFLRLSSNNSNNDIRGLSAAVSQYTKWLINVGSLDIRLKHEVATSSAGNRFTCPGSADFILAPAECVMIKYDLSTSRWRVFGLAQNKNYTFTGTLFTVPTLISTGSVSSDNDVTADGDITAGGEFVHDDPTSHLRTMLVPLTTFVDANGTSTRHWILDVKETSVDGSDAVRLTNSSPNGEECASTVRLAHGVEIKSVKLACNQSTAGATTEMKLRAVHYTMDKTASFSTPTATLLGTVTSSGAGDHVLAIASLSQTFDSSTDYLVVRVTSSDAGGAETDKVYWCEITFYDPGPRNY